jgi:hypothetical protein
MNTVTANHLARVALGPAQTHRHIAVVPLVGPDAGPAPYLTLSEALAGRCLTVTEVSEGGSVPELKVISRCDRPVLLLDGEELVGAKQNRVLNTTILLEPRAEARIPVSCVEQGRWSYASASFAASGVVMSHKSRARKTSSVSYSLSEGAHYLSDQGEVWAEVASLQQKAKVASPTGAMQDVFKARADELEECIRIFTPTASQTGLLVLVDGEVAGFDLVAHADAYRKLHGQLLRSYLLDALVEPKPGRADAAQAAAGAQAFLRETGQCGSKAFPSVGQGTDYRFQQPGLAGSALVQEDRLVHAVFFRLPAGDSAERRMAPTRQRRRRFTE